MHMKRIALVEIGGSHDECLLTQMRALHGGSNELLLYTTQPIVDRNPSFVNYLSQTHILSMSGSKSDKKREIKRLWSSLKEQKVDVVVLNTAQGKLILSLVLKALFSKIQCVGIIHTSRMFKESFTQKLISLKVKKYLVLSEFIKNDCPVSRNIKLDWFYPLDFPSVSENLVRDPNHFVIIGGVETRRKDLDGFLTLAASAPDSIRWTFLGKSDANSEEVRSFLEELELRNLTDRVTYFSDFVDQQTFVDTLATATGIVPLIHPDTNSADQYFKNQIPGAMNVALAFKIPMLIHEQYTNWTEIKDAAVYYNFDDFSDKINGLISNFEVLNETMERQEKFNGSFHRKSYSQFVLN